MNLTQLSKLSGVAIPRTGSPDYIGWTVDTVPAYVDWRACTATPLSGVS